MFGFAFGVMVLIGVVSPSIKVFWNEYWDFKYLEMRLNICYDYNSNNGDYYWRHENCKALEKEVLEMKTIKWIY